MNITVYVARLLRDEPLFDVHLQSDTLFIWRTSTTCLHTFPYISESNINTRGTYLVRVINLHIDTR